MNEPNNKFYYMKTQRKIGKSGRAFHTGKFAYAIEIVGFEKDDGSITWWLQPKDMDQIKQYAQAKAGQHPYAPQAQSAYRPPPPSAQAYQSQRPPAPQQQAMQKPAPERETKPYVDHTRPTEPEYGDPGPSMDDEIPF